MMWRRICAIVLGMATLAPAAARLETAPRGPLVHTYSIVARDSRTGDMGVAV
jgi:hypothetical protein